MGGGSLAAALKKQAKTLTVKMTPAAAATVHHDKDRVRASGIDIISNSMAEAEEKKGEWEALFLGDIDADRLRCIVQAFGVPFSFDIIG